jgi:two-component system CheB/CheR fusion protein
MSTIGLPLSAPPPPAATPGVEPPERLAEREELRRLNRTLRALSNSSHAMLHATDEASYLAEVCRIVVEDCGHAMVSIGFAEQGPDKAVRPVAHAGFEAGYASSIVFPLLEEGRPFGAITIYSGEPDPFLEDEQRLLEELADDLAHGVTNLRERAARQLAEEGRRNSEARLAAIVESLAEGLIVSDLDGELLHWNRAALEMHGLASLAEVRRRLEDFATIYELSTPGGSVLPVAEWPLARILRGEVVRDLELRLRRLADGWSRIYRYGGCRVLDANGLPTLAVLTIGDVTERHRTEEELRRVHERAASLARFPEENPDPVLRLRSDLTVAYANQAALASLAALDLRLDQPAPPALDEPARRAQVEGSRCRQEVACGERFFTFSFCPVGTEVNVYGQEVTDLKRTQDALRESEQRFRQLAASLQEADVRKNEFLGVLSHELRNPLAPIQYALHILDRAPAGSEQAQRAKEVIGRQAGHMARLVDDLLDVTRISHGKIHLRRGRVEVGGLAGRVVEDHRTLFAAKEIALDLQIEDGPIWLDADATRISQSIANLLQNAAKFTNAQGHVAVWIGRRGSTAVVRVSDDGIGIAPEVLPDLFRPFRQVDESLHRSAGGLGLGLALVKGLVEMHGGSVEAHSDGIGHGAEFTISLPLGAEVDPLAQPVTGTPTAPRRRRLLVIDDSRDAAGTLREVLELAGNEVEVAYDGLEGVAKARALKPEVVFCDIGLPGLDGYAVARQLRADPTFTPTLIALSGYALPADQRKALEAGFDHHLGKPLDLKELEALLARVTPRRAGG